MILAYINQEYIVLINLVQNSGGKNKDSLRNLDKGDMQFLNILYSYKGGEFLGGKLRIFWKQQVLS